MTKELTFLAWLAFPVFVWSFLKLKEEDFFVNLAVAAFITAVFEGFLYCLIRAGQVVFS